MEYTIVVKDGYVKIEIDAMNMPTGAELEELLRPAMDRLSGVKPDLDDLIGVDPEHQTADVKRAFNDGHRAGFKKATELCTECIKLLEKGEFCSALHASWSKGYNDGIAAEREVKAKDKTYPAREAYAEGVKHGHEEAGADAEKASKDDTDVKLVAGMQKIARITGDLGAAMKWKDKSQLFDMVRDIEWVAKAALDVDVEAKTEAAKNTIEMNDAEALLRGIGGISEMIGDEITKKVDDKK